MPGPRLHFDCFSGLAGDMFLGACLDLGLPFELLEDTVARLGLEGVTLERREAERGGIRGVRFRVLVGGAP
ncbi:MAG TPA: nickel insertion protein, partial [Thermoanaerobaculia bacterium]|nr:nickel insertion protein [Thermoanaerobaculia bacterium]